MNVIADNAHVLADLERPQISGNNTFQRGNEVIEEQSQSTNENSAVNKKQERKHKTSDLWKTKRKEECVRPRSRSEVRSRDNHVAMQIQLKKERQREAKRNAETKEKKATLLRSNTVVEKTPEKKRAVLERSHSIDSSRSASVHSQTPLLSEEMPSSKKSKKAYRPSFSTWCNRIKQLSAFHPTKPQYKYLDSDTFPADSDFDELVANSKAKLRRSVSVPYNLDEEEFVVEDLFLPRRMAICPEVRTPAIKQLETYLVLTRLKQYNFL